MLVWIESLWAVIASEWMWSQKFLQKEIKALIEHASCLCVDGCFLNIEIGHLGSTGDFLVFSLLQLKHKLEQDAFLKDGSHLFGDNTYDNTKFIATPTNWQLDQKPTTTFIHSRSESKLSAHLECWFGLGESCNVNCQLRSVWQNKPPFCLALAFSTISASTKEIAL